MPFTSPYAWLVWLAELCVEKTDSTQLIHIYLDENGLKPDGRYDLRPNGFTRESVFQDFPIRGQEVLLYVRRRRWLDKENHNVMTECTLIQESTRCSTGLADFLKDAFGDAPYNGPFVWKGLPHRWRRIRPCLQGPYQRIPHLWGTEPCRRMAHLSWKHWSARKHCPSSG